MVVVGEGCENSRIYQQQQQQLQGQHGLAEDKQHPVYTPDGHPQDPNFYQAIRHPTTIILRNPPQSTKGPPPPPPKNTGPCQVSSCTSNGGRCGLLPTQGVESYYGYVETVEDAIMIVEACRYGRLARVKRRLGEKDRQMIRSGSVFVFVERESGIRRWTDGKIWSPSRICGEFLLYRELDQRSSGHGKRSTFSGENFAAEAEDLAIDDSNMEATESIQKKQKILISSPKDPTISPPDSLRDSSSSPECGYEGPFAGSSRISEESKTFRTTKSASSGNGNIFRKDGLIKKTISLKIAEETYHLICYFRDSNLGSQLLHLTPSRLVSFEMVKSCKNALQTPVFMVPQQPTPTQPPPQHQVYAGGMMPGVYHQLGNPNYVLEGPPFGYTGAIPMASGPYGETHPHFNPSNIQQPSPQQQQTATGPVQIFQYPATVLLRPTWTNASPTQPTTLQPQQYQKPTMQHFQFQPTPSSVMQSPCGHAANLPCPTFSTCPRRASCPSVSQQTAFVESHPHQHTEIITPPPSTSPEKAAEQQEEDHLLFCHFLDSMRGRAEGEEVEKSTTVS